MKQKKDKRKQRAQQAKKEQGKMRREKQWREWEDLMMQAQYKGMRVHEALDGAVVMRGKGRGERVNVASEKEDEQGQEQVLRTRAWVEVTRRRKPGTCVIALSISLFIPPMP